MSKPTPAVGQWVLYNVSYAQFGRVAFARADVLLVDQVTVGTQYSPEKTLAVTVKPDNVIAASERRMEIESGYRAIHAMMTKGPSSQALTQAGLSAINSTRAAHAEITARMEASRCLAPADASGSGSL